MKFFTVVFLIVLSYGYSDGFEDEFIGLPIQFEDHIDDALFWKSNDVGEPWSAHEQRQTDEDWEETLAKLCRNTDMTLNGEPVDCESLEIIPKSGKTYQHEIKKREAEPSDLQEGSGNEQAEDEPLEQVTTKPVSEIPSVVEPEATKSETAESETAESTTTEQVPPETVVTKAVPAKSEAPAVPKAAEPAVVESVAVEPVKAETVTTESVPAVKVPAVEVPALQSPEKQTESTSTVQVPKEQVPEERVPGEADKKSTVVENKEYTDIKAGRILTKEYVDDKQSGNAVVNGIGGTMEDTENALSKEKPSESIINASEEPKSGESSENTTQAGAGSNKLLIGLFVAVVVVGGAAFTYNYVKKKKSQNNRRAANGEARNDAEEGKEMKPLVDNVGEKVSVEYKDEKEEAVKA